MLSELARRAKAAGIPTLHLEYLPSEKNVPIHGFYRSIEAAIWQEENNYFSLSSTQGAVLRFTPAPTERRSQETTERAHQSTKSPRAMAFIARELNTLEKISEAVRVWHSKDIAVSSTRAPTTPANELEAILAAIYAEVLRTGQVDTETSFFDLGGTSLQLVELASRVSEKLEKNIPITALFQFPSIAALARHLSGSGDKKGKMSKARERAQRQRQMIRRLQVA